MTDFTDLENVQSNTDFNRKQYLQNQGIIINYTTTQGLILKSENVSNAQNMWQLANQIENVSVPLFFPQTSTNDGLKLYHGNTWGVTLSTASSSNGNAIFQGTATTSISINTEVSDGAQSYLTTQVGLITTTIVDVASIVVAGGVATVTLDEDFTMGSGINCTILGATPSELNVVDEPINVTDSNIFTFASAATPGAATGTITATFTMAVVPIQAAETGLDTNQDNGATLTMVNTVADIDDNLYVSYDGLTGGTDQETDISYRSRILNVTQNIPQAWNKAAINQYITEFDNAKYRSALVYTPRAENTAGVETGGYTTIYFLKEGNLIPTASEITELRDYLIDNYYPTWGLTTAFQIVAPTVKDVTVEIQLTGVYDTSAMRTAVLDSVRNIFLDTSFAYFRTDVLYQGLVQRIRQTYDANGTFLLDNFTLVLPVADVTLLYDEFPFLENDTVVFS